MARKAPRPANIEGFERLLRKYYANQRSIFPNPEPDEPVILPITQEVMRYALRLAQPIYDLINGLMPFPVPISGQELREVERLLKANGLRFKTLRAVPAKCPEAVSHMISQSRWESIAADLYWYEHDRTARYEDELINLGIWTIKPPRDFYRLARHLDKNELTERIDPEKLLNFVISAVEHLLTPPHQLSPRRRKRLLQRIETHLSIATRWPILGSDPQNRDILYILVA